MTGPLLQSPTPARTLTEALALPLGAYRRDHVHACVVRVMRREHATDIAALVELVDEKPDVRTRLRRAIAVSTTGLFRDPDQLRWIDSTIMPELAAGRRYARCWSAGCAAGEEAFTLAMMLEWHGMLGRSEVTGSDILEEALEEAQTGVVGGARIPAGMRERVAWDLRDLVTGGAPEQQFELVLCRNVLGFLAPAAADAVSRTLATALVLGGVLAIGREERLANAAELGLAEVAPHAYKRVR